MAPVADRNSPMIRVSVDLPVGSYNHLVMLVGRANENRPDGAYKLRLGPLLRSLAGSWMRRANGGAGD